MRQVARSGASRQPIAYLRIAASENSESTVTWPVENAAKWQGAWFIIACLAHSMARKWTCHRHEGKAHVGEIRLFALGD